MSEIEEFWLLEATSNNAIWCAAIADSHNIASSRCEGVWFCEHRMPPLYPNMVTLNRGEDFNQHIDHIDPLLQSGWAVKDSFKKLKLEERGFTPAFDAFWYCMIPGDRKVVNEASVSHVKRVKNQSELNRWEKAWGAKTDVFRPSLLLDDAVEILFTEKDSQIVAGVATNKSGESVGISNAFGQHSGIIDCINSIADNYPSKGIVGYGDRDEVTKLSKFGFREIGELRIWFRS